MRRRPRACSAARRCKAAAEPARPLKRHSRRSPRPHRARNLTPLAARSQRRRARCRCGCPRLPAAFPPCARPAALRRATSAVRIGTTQRRWWCAACVRVPESAHSAEEARHGSRYGRRSSSAPSAQGAAKPSGPQGRDRSPPSAGPSTAPAPAAAVARQRRLGHSASLLERTPRHGQAAEGPRGVAGVRDVRDDCARRASGARAWRCAVAARQPGACSAARDAHARTQARTHPLSWSPACR
jgi:hypothetical protein